MDANSCLSLKIFKTTASRSVQKLYNALQVHNRTEEKYDNLKGSEISKVCETTSSTLLVGSRRRPENITSSKRI